jgi:phosphoglycolate phosphatase-like HAD superfamily hydrolase
MHRAKDDPELRARFERTRCLLLDCDGILFDSNGFKIEGMRRALSEEPEALVAQMVEFWRQSGGVSRWAKFRHYFEEISPAADVEAAIDSACERFGAYSLAAYDEHAPLPEGLQVVRAVGPLRAVVVSGASQAELETVFTRKGIAPLFSEILGSPTTKLDLVVRVLTTRALDAEEVLFIGDGAGDYQVARDLCVPFIFLNQFTDWTGARDALRDDPSVVWAEDWNELLAAFGLS